ncbi:acyloxyacyl hydrolase, partial [Desulfovibrio sp. OttesenSCG-928-A18]|nr:acyloxyacyl hydrolase [Desulfovibrio sp. OttesenSCG-928-A18]
MKNTASASFLLLLITFLSAHVALAASTSVGVGVSRGNSDSMSYSLNITQRYDHWVDNEIFQLGPTAELGAHAWVDDNSDTVWGAYLAPGLQLNLFTSSAIRPFIAGSVGVAVNSEDKLDERDLGSHVLLRSKGSVGVSFGEGYRHRIQGEFINYSTWGISNT